MVAIAERGLLFICGSNWDVFWLFKISFGSISTFSDLFLTIFGPISMIVGPIFDDFHSYFLTIFSSIFDGFETFV